MQLNSVNVQTQYGPVRGIKKLSALGRNYFSFQSIPYMKAPLGKLRFRDAQPPEIWTEPLDVTMELGAFCMKSFLNYNDEGVEDAGFVNVYTPHTDPNLMPVLVWFHGGGWNSGSGQTDVFGPDYFMQKDVVLVTVNYRLGPMGFLSLDDPTLNIPGNAGLKDQNFALKWVQSNIANFGGNPSNVTIFGQSAGGASTHYHMLSHQSKGLFHRAISMSGSAFCTSWALIQRLDWAFKLAKKLGYSGENVDKEVLEFLEKPDGMALVLAAKDLLTIEQEIGMHLMFAFGPCIEPYESKNCFIPMDPILMARECWSKDLNFIIGGTSNEGILPLIMLREMLEGENTELLDKENSFAPVIQLGIDINSDKAAKYGRQIKENYFGKSKSSATDQQPLMNFFSDHYNWHAVQRVSSSRLKAFGSGKTYFYRFDVDLSQNLTKQLFADELLKYHGAAHGDDLPYIFKTNLKLTSPALDSKEFGMIRRMIETFSAFATTGDPNNCEISEKWEPIKFPLKCLNIAEDKSAMIDFPESERLKIWDEIFEIEKVDLI